MDALEAIARRRSVRKYTTDPVSRDLLRKVVEAARLAPSAHNDQPCEFIVVTDRDQRRRIADLTDHGKFIAQAPACILVLARPHQYFLEEGCAAVSNMLIAATAFGLATCWVAGDKQSYAEHVAACCGAPAELRLVAMVAVGYAAEEPSHTKRPLEQLLHWETYARDAGPASAPRPL
jgi:nitroreductase